MKPLFAFSRLVLAFALYAAAVCSTAPAAPVFDPGNPPASATPPTEAYQRFTGAFSHQKGPKTIMFIYVRPSDGDMPTVKTHAQLAAELDGTSQAYYDASYRQAWFGPVVRNFGQSNQFTVPRLEVPPVVNLPGTVQQYKDSFALLQTDSQNAVRALGGQYASGQPLDPANFDRVQVFGSPTLISSTGLAYVGGRFSWSGNSLSGTVVQHELGHNWGVFHANLWNGANGIPRNATGTHAEYGDGSDVMGGGNTLFNAMFRDRLGFLERTRGEVQTITSSGTYRLFAFTNPESRRAETNVRSLLLPVEGAGSSQKHKFLGFRHATGADGGLSRNDWERNAVQVHAHNTSATFGDNDGSHFLDTTPGSRTGGSSVDRNDGAIKIGRTYSEGPALNGAHIYGGVHITPVARGSLSAGGHTHQYIDVVVNYGNSVSPSNQPPVASFASAVFNIAAGTPLELSVQASDPEGDALAFDWDFGDSTYSLVSSATQTKTWSAPGFYLVRCTVSDMKGGVADAFVWVNVGDQSYAPPATATTAGGLHYRYYEGSWSTLPTFENLLPVASGTVNGFDLGIRQRNDNFAILYTGFIQIPEQNVYQFRIRHDDGVRLVIAGQTVINRPGEFSAAEESSGNIALQPGLHSVRLEYFHRTGAETLQVRYWTAGAAEASVPAGWLVQNSWSGNAAPVVAITSPGEGETFVVNSDILIQADASDDQAVARVAFFGNGAYLGQSTAAPHAVTWEKVSVGPKTLTAIAYDAAGRYTVSAPVSITVNSPPPAQGFGLNFGAQNDATRIQFGERAGAVYSYPNWNNLSGATGDNFAAIDHLGFATPVRVTHRADGAGSGTFENLAETASANGRLMRGGLNRRHDIEPSPNPNPFADVSNIPYTTYDVYVYFDYLNTNADDTIPQRFVLTPSEGPAPAARFGRNSASSTNGVGDYPAYDTFNGFREATATSLGAPAAELFGNYVVFRGQTAPAFRIEATRNGNPALDNGSGRQRRYFNAIQVIERPASGPGLVVRRVGGSTTVSESGQTAAVTVSLAVAPTAPVTVTVSPDAQLGVDRTTLTFTAENFAQAQALTISAVNDTALEGAHTGTLTFTAGGGNYTGLAALPLTVQILDNDLPLVSVRAAGSLREGQAGTAAFRFSRSGLQSLAEPVTVGFQMSGTAAFAGDYTLSGASVSFNTGTGAGSVVIPAGQSQVALTVSAVNDSTREYTETATLTLQPAAGLSVVAPDGATLVIHDDDATDYLTEIFNNSTYASRSWDLNNTAITFSPSGGTYTVTTEAITAFPSGTSSFTSFDKAAMTSGTSSAGWWSHTLSANFTFFGVAYSQLFVNTEGAITFGSGTSLSGFGTNMFGNTIPKIALYWSNLDPGAAGNVQHRRISDGANSRTVLYYNAVRVVNTSSNVSAQAELFDDGRIRLSWLSAPTHTNTLVVGLATGVTNTMPSSNYTDTASPRPFFQSDLSLYPPASPNVAPAFATVPPVAAIVGQAYSYLAAASDANGDALVFTTPAKPAWLTLADHGDGTATLSGTPPFAGSFAVTLRASDGTLQTDQSFTLIAGPAGGNSAPAFTSVPPVLVNAGAGYVYSISTTDADGQTPALSATQLPGWLTLTALGDGQATLSGTAPTTDVTTFGVTLVATDGLASTAQSFSLQVNRAPLIQIAQPFGAVASLAAPGTLALAATVTDDGLPAAPGEFTLAWSTVSGPAPVVFAEPSSAATAATFPANGLYQLRLTAHDGAATSTRDVFVSVGSDPNAALATGLVGHWRFDEQSGTSAADSSGNNNHLTLNGASTFGVGFAGNALVTSASDTQFAERALAQPAQFTFSAWINSTVAPADGTSERHIFGFRGGTNDRARLLLRPTVSQLRFRSAHSTNGVWDTTDYRLPANQWVHVALAYDQSSTANHPVLYIDGEPVALTRVTAPSGSVNSSDSLRVGGYTNSGNAWKGRIDEVRLHNRVLPAAELAATLLPAAVNQAPSVSAALQNAIPSGQNSGVLVGAVSDDGLPAGGQLSTLWTRVGGPDAVVIADPEALETAVTFAANGTYTFRLTASDGALSSSADLSFEVRLDDPEPTTVVVAPATATISPSGTQAFAATVLDQFGQAMSGQSVSWQVSGGGSINGAGLFTASAAEGGPFTVTATSGAISGTAQVTVFNQLPTIGVIADQVLQIGASGGPLAFTVGDAETPAGSLLVTAASGNQTLLPDANLVLGGSGAERTITVTPAAGQTGSATVTLTVTDGGGKTAQTAFLVVVQAGTPASIVVTPATAQVLPGGTLQFGAVVRDQNNLPLDPQPAVTWSVGGGGSINASGLFTAGVALGGPHTVTASLDALQGTASITIANTAPSIAILGPSASPLGLQNLANHLLLHAEASDAESTPSVAWTQVSGPVGGTAEIADPAAALTSVRFPVAGTYVLRATASDGFLAAQQEITVEAGATPGVGGGVERVTLLDTDFGAGVTNTGLAAITFSGDNGNKSIGFSGAGSTSAAGAMWTLGDTGVFDLVGVNSVTLGGFTWGSTANPIRRGVIFTTAADFGYLTPNGQNTNIRYANTSAITVQLNSGTAHESAFNLVFEVKPDTTLSDVLVGFRAGTAGTSGVWDNNTAAQNGNINVVIHPLNASGVAGTGVSFFASPQAIGAGAGPTINAPAPEGASFAAGRYLLRIVFSGKTRNERATIDDLVFSASTGPVAIPFAPNVDPGAAPAGVVVGSPAALAGSASDPAGEAPTTLWSLASGPGAAQFADSAAASTAVTFTAAGDHTLRFAAANGFALVFQDLAVGVAPADDEPDLGALFADWAEAANLPEDRRGLLDTPFADGVPNLVRFALALPADAPVGAVHGPVETEGGELRLTYTRRAGLPGLQIHAESSPNLAAGSWTRVGVQETVLSTLDGVETVEASVPIVQGRHFLRVRVEVSAP
jgi:hypothetical protein